MERRKNVAVAAVARGLSCLIWGMMTGNICTTTRICASAPAVSKDVNRMMTRSFTDVAANQEAIRK